MFVLIILSILYVAALLCLLWVAHKNKRLYAVAKAFCSSLFLACALLSGRLASQYKNPVFVLLVLALLLCAFGDVFLGIANQKAIRPSKRPFLAGAASFTAAHAVFCVLFYSTIPLAWHDIVMPGVLLAVLYLLERRGLIRLKKVRPVAYVYTVCVALMAGKAVQLSFAQGAGGQGHLLLGVGAALFLVSDAILLFLYFGTRRKKWMRTANLTTYYCGVYLMALSALWV